MLKKKKKIGKNPAVNTSFLPDKDREAQELQEIGLLHNGQKTHILYFRYSVLS